MNMRGGISASLISRHHAQVGLLLRDKLLLFVFQDGIEVELFGQLGLALGLALGLGFSG